MHAQLKPEYQAFLPNQDWHLEHLYDFLPQLGITTIQATHSRYVADLNRKLTDKPFGDFWSSVIPNQTAFKKPLYHTPLSSEQIKWQIDNYYHNYHAKLLQILNTHIAQYGRVLLLDLHSFGALAHNDVILGNAKGSTCSEALFAKLNSGFQNQNFDVVQNKVFTGGYITRHYATLDKVQTVQIELRYELYLNPDKLDKPCVPEWRGPNFDKTKKNLHALFTDLTEQLDFHRP